MANKTKVADTTVERGVNMKTGKGWRLVSKGGKAFKAALLTTIDVAGERLAVFRISKLKP